MNEFTLREATLEDLTVLLHFEQGVIEAERPFDPTIEQGEVHYYDLPYLIASNDAQVIVAQKAQTIVACGYALKKQARHYLDHHDYAYMGFMYTHPDFRGKGINALIIGKLKAWAFEKGLLEMRLTVYEGNLPAITAYEKMGFNKHIVEMRLRD